MKIWTDIKQEFRVGNNLTRIMYINVGVFVALFLIRLLSWLFTASDQSGLYGFVIKNIQTYLNPDFLILKPWTLFTYMFTHESFFHILFNMLWLYWMGRIFIDLLNGKRLVAIYLLGGIAGALLSLAAFQLLPALKPAIESGNPAPMLGASAAVMAITAAIATYVPNYEIRLLFFGNVAIKYIALVAVGLDILFLPDGNAGGRFAHIGGALFGFVWAYKLKQGTDISKWFMTVLDSVAVWFRPKPKSHMHVSYKNKKQKKGTYVHYEETNTSSSQTEYSQAEIDTILEKVARSGYESLTAKEKKILFSSSNRNRK
ncbi:MAG: rhomboid family intramembrane serine protease [Bacteroidales bacterium]